MNDNWPIPQTQHWIGPQENVQSTLKKVPIHRQMMQYFEAQHKNALLQPGDKLPSERALSAQFSITRMTVRQALIRLEAEGLIFREQRRGWFFSLPRITYDPTLNTSFTENIAKQGRTLETTVLFKKKINASRWLSQILDCDIGAPVFLVNRKKAVDGRVVLVEQIYSPVKWTACIQTIIDSGVTNIVECGPGKVLSGLNRRIDKSLRSFSLEEPDGLQAAAAELA